MNQGFKSDLAAPEQRSVVQKLNHPTFNKYSVEVYIKRDDLIHPVISGNKWRKLKYNLNQVAKNKTIISFGGSYSNHIHALAFACQEKGLNSVGIIRGEASNADNFTLSCARKWGMDLVFVDRKTYRERSHLSFHKKLQTQYPDGVIIPEGGSNKQALLGVAEIIDEAKQQVAFDTVLTPIGSGGTLAGLALGTRGINKVIGISVLKGANYLQEEVKSLLAQHQYSENNWHIEHDYHCGGYAKFKQEHLDEILQIQQELDIPLEPVYSGKMFRALLKMLEAGRFESGSNILLIHTGGLQGLHGMVDRKLLKASDWQLPRF